MRAELVIAADPLRDDGSFTLLHAAALNRLHRTSVPRTNQARAQGCRGHPRARLVEIGGVGHVPHLEAPERFHSALLEFLR